MPRTSKEMIKLLEANGFEYVRSNGSHRFYRNAKTGKNNHRPIPQQNTKARDGAKHFKTGRADLKPCGFAPSKSRLEVFI